MGTPDLITPKQQAHALIDQLPETATLDDVIEKLRFCKAVQDGIAAADRGDFAEPEAVRAAFARWGAELET